MKSSEAFEGPNSSLRKTFDEAAEPAFVGGHQDGGTVGLWKGEKLYTQQEVDSPLASERADWLRSEIEMLEGMKLKDKKEYPKLFPREWADCCWEGEMNGYNQALTTIITRYKEELKVLKEEL